MARRGDSPQITPHAAGFGSTTAEAGGVLRFGCDSEIQTAMA